MANKIISFLGFKIDNGVLKSVVGGLNDVRTSSIRAALGINDITRNLKKMADIQSVAALSMTFKNTANSIKSAVSGISQAYKKIVGLAGEGDRIAKTSKMLGLGVEEYQVFASAAKHSGMSVEDLDAAFKKFNVTLGKARAGDKDSLKKITSIMPDGYKLSDLKDVSSVLAAVSDGYTKLSTAEQKAFVSQELFGKSGIKISEMLKNGSEGLWQAYKEFNENGGGFSEEGAENAEIFNDELQKTAETLHSIKVSVMQELFPTFIEMFKQIRVYLKENGGELRKKLVDVGKAVSRFVLDVLPKIPGYLDTIFNIINKISGESLVKLGLLLYFSPVIGSIIVLLFSVFKVVGIISRIGFGILAGVKSVVLWLRKWTIILRPFMALKGVALGTLGLILLKIAVIVAGIVGWVIAIKSVIKNLNLVPDAIDWIWTSIKESFEWWWNQLKAVVSWAADGIGGVFRNIGEGIRDFVMGGLDTIYGAVQKIKGFLSGLFGSFPDKVKSFFGIQDSINSNDQSSIQTLGASAAQAVQESRTTVTNRFAVDFKNMPRGVVVTPPEHGDFDYSRGYVLGGI